MPKVNTKAFVALWLISPFFSAVYLFKNFKQNSSIAPYLLLSIFFGLSFVVSTTGSDSERYATALLTYNHNSITLSEVLDTFYSEEDNKLDVYQPILTWLVSLITDNAKLLFALFALVFGYFWCKSLLLIRSYITVPLKGLVLASFLALILTNPIWNINGVRMWTAAIIFFYGLLILKVENNKRGWLFLILPMFVHFSLLIALALYVTYFLLPVKNKNVLFWIFLLTFFFGELDLALLRSYFEQLPGFAQSKGAYLNEENEIALKTGDHLYAPQVILAQTLTKYSVFFMAVLIYFHTVYKKKTASKQLESFFPIALFFASFSNLATSVPSGGRFLVLSNLIMISAFLFFLNQNIRIPVFQKKLLIASLSFIIIFNIRLGLDFVGLFFFIGNPILNWFVVDQPIIDFIKMPF